MYRFSCKKGLLALFLLIVLTFALVSCGDTNELPDDSTGSAETTDPVTEAETEAETEPPYEISLVTDGKATYKIVTPEDCSEELFELAKDLSAAIKKKTGVTLQIGNDFVSNIPGFQEAECEILIGDCDRDATREVKATLRSKDYAVSVVDKKLVIVGGTDSRTETAVNVFIKQLLTDDTVLQSGELYRFDAKYSIDKMTLNGHDIREYQIVYQRGKSTVYEGAAEVLCDAVRNLAGYSLEIVESDAPIADCEILLGDCGREGVTKLTPADAFSYSVSVTEVGEGCKIAIDASNAVAVKAAVSDWFSKNFSDSATGDYAEELAYGETSGTLSFGKKLANGATMRVMTNNILGDGTFGDRVPLLLDIYMEYFPDIIGFQEFPSSAYSQIATKLSDYYGVANRTIGKTTTLSHTPILYRKDLYEVVESETFFYDGRWPKTNTKTLAWSIFQNKQTGEQFAVLNTHYAIVSSAYDTEAEFGKVYTNAVEGAMWRNDNSRQVLETVEKIRTKYGNDLPIMFMGDLNSNVNSDALKAIEEVLDEAASVATISKTTGSASWHNVGKAPATNTLPIDYVYVNSDRVNVYTHLIPYTDTDVIKSSDHCPVICDISFNN